MKDIKKTYYELLGVNQNATPVEIKCAYRKMAMKYHPDNCKDKDWTKMMYQINEAYAVLRDTEARTTYDELLRKEKLHSKATKSEKHRKEENSETSETPKSYKLKKTYKSYNSQDDYNYVDFDDRDYITWLEEFIDDIFTNYSSEIGDNTIDILFASFERILETEKSLYNEPTKHTLRY